MEVSIILAFIGFIVFLAHLLTEIFSRTKVPDVLSLFLLGFLIGPVFKFVSPDDFGAVGPVFTTVTLVIILFEGGIDLKLKELTKTMKPAGILATVNFTATVFVVSAVSYFLTDLGFRQSLMLGAIVGGTSSAVVIPLVEHLSLKNKSKSILILESALSDVLCIVFALAFLEAFKLGELKVGHLIGRVLSSFILAALIGGTAAAVWSIVLNKIRPLQNSLFTTPAFVFITYALSDVLGFSGAISALTFGIVLGNTNILKIPLLKKYILAEPLAPNNTEKIFFGEIVFLLKTFFFIYIGISIQLKDPLWFSFGLLLTFVIYLIRIPVVRVSAFPDVSKSDASYMGAIVPKGLAAAVLASIPLQQGVDGGEFIQNVTFSIILFSIILTSILIFLLENKRFAEFYTSLFWWRNKNVNN